MEFTSIIDVLITKSAFNKCSIPYQYAIHNFYIEKSEIEH